MNYLKHFSKITDKINTKIGKIFSWFTLLLIILVCIDVLLRYIFNYSIVAMQELEWHIFAIIFLMGASFTLLENGHVRVDVFYIKFSEKTKAVINIIGTIFLLIPFCVIIIWTSFEFVSISFSINETSPDGGGLPARFIIKSFIPISFFFLLLQGLSLLINSIIFLIENKNE